MKNAIGYIRVATKGDYEKQRNAILQFCSGNDYCATRFLCDFGNASSQWETLLRERVVDKANYQAIVICDNAHIAKTRNEFLFHYFKLAKQGIRLRVIHDSFNCDLDILAILKEIAIKCQGNDIQKVSIQKDRAKLGVYSGGRPPYGYNAVNRKLVINEQESEIVKRLFALYDSGMNYHQIAVLFNNEYVPLRNTNRWATSQVRNMVLNRRFYQGQFKCGNNTWVKGEHEPIL